jgi:hypothetical protein
VNVPPAGDYETHGRILALCTLTACATAVSQGLDSRMTRFGVVERIVESILLFEVLLWVIFCCILFKTFVFGTLQEFDLFAALLFIFYIVPDLLTPLLI